MTKGNGHSDYDEITKKIDVTSFVTHHQRILHLEALLSQALHTAQDAMSGATAIIVQVQQCHGFLSQAKQVLEDLKE